MSNPDFSSERLESVSNCGDFDFRIARDGIWYYRGSPITRTALSKLFSTILRRDENGEYWLVTPVERCRIAVDDAPFTAIELTVEGKGRDQALIFRTNFDEIVAADRDHPIRVSYHPESEEPSPYVLVRPALEALIVRPVFYQLAELAETCVIDEREWLGVWSRGEFFTLGPSQSEAAR